jgi:type IV secretion system protein VirB9
MTAAKRLAIAGLVVAAMSNSAPADAAATDPRLRDVFYDPHAVVTVPVKRGVVTLVELQPGDSITEIAAGLGGDCSKMDAAWCIAAQPGGRDIYVKAKSRASAPNNLAVVASGRTYSFKFVVLADRDPKTQVYRLRIKARPAAAPPPAPQSNSPPQAALPAVPPPPSSDDLVEARLRAKPEVMNSNYSIAEGRDSEAIVPKLVFDDGRFTYFRFPGNGALPAVFDVLGDGSETLVNARMEDNLLVVDRVSRHLMLRAGSAVVGVWNESFDIDGVAPAGGTTVP